MERQQNKNENILYLVLWTILFAAPILSVYADMEINSDHFFVWEKVFEKWKILSMFCAAFLVHNFLLAPLLVYRKRKWIYLPSLICLMVCFELYQCNCQPSAQEPPAFANHHESRQGPPPMREGEFRPEPPKAFGGNDSVAFIIMSLLLAMNVGTKFFFKTTAEQKHAHELEKQNLNQQLEYLKYQINPHFFMNTLNNIHALVDINPEDAKVTIEVLSKLMRYVLYESNKPFTLLKNEIRFIGNYIDLMKIRYTDSVRISVSMPDSIPERTVPPLLFISFIENAFKHGISYDQPSFVEVKILTDGEKVDFLCHNSRKPSAESKQGGVGLQNVKKRLELIYGKDYALFIVEGKNDFDVKLRIPLLEFKNIETTQ